MELALTRPVARKASPSTQGAPWWDTEHSSAGARDSAAGQRVACVLVGPLCGPVEGTADGSSGVGHQGGVRVERVDADPDAALVPALAPPKRVRKSKSTRKGSKPAAGGEAATGTPASASTALVKHEQATREGRAPGQHLVNPHAFTLIVGGADEAAEPTDDEVKRAASTQPVGGGAYADVVSVDVANWHPCHAYATLRLVVTSGVTASAVVFTTPTLLPVLAVVGPVIGRVTHDSAVVLLEVDQPARVACVLTDAFTGQRCVA